MIISNPREFFVVVRSMNCSELGLEDSDSRLETSRCFRNEENNNIEFDSKAFEDDVKNYFIKIADIASVSSSDQVYRMLESVYDSMIKAHEKYLPEIPCINDINSMRQNYVISSKDGERRMDDKVLKENIDDINNKIDKSVKEISELSKDNSYRNVLSAHLIMERTLLSLAEQFISK